MVKSCLKILIEDIVVDGEKVTVMGKNEALTACLEQKETFSAGGVAPVLNRVNKWRPICTAVKNLTLDFSFSA